MKYREYKLFHLMNSSKNKIKKKYNKINKKKTKLNHNYN